MLDHVTVAVGNRAEVEVAVGTSDPRRGCHSPARPGSGAGPGEDGRRGRARRHARQAATWSRRTRSRSSAASAPVTPSAAPSCTACCPAGTRSRSRGHANAAGAIVASRLACADAMPTLDELTHLVDSQGGARMTVAAGPADQRAAWSDHHRHRVAGPARAPRHRPRRGRQAPTPPDAVPAGSSPSGGRSSSSPPTTRPAVSLASGGDAMAMADRRSLLARLVEALQHPDVDGVLGTPDIIEELLLLGALEDKVVIGSMNRGGLDGATWTMDDRFTGYDAAEHRRLWARGRQDAAPHRRHRRRDRRPPSRPVPRPSASSPRLGLVAMVEPLPYERDERRDPVPAQGRARAVPRGHDRLGPGHHQCLHVAEDAGVRRLRDGLRVDHAALRRARRRTELRPGRGPRVVGQ